ncbi:hypothetical protein F2Q68_00045185 [Brassica cretica]|uniref:Uncharacterized protein n=1 Tax=Brassica cretica TaxID=69181 RepID=A0A8S9LK47_BRACR|nr:hypothetical protein F2Q68_00045185 [Brassica cretica]
MVPQVQIASTRNHPRPLIIHTGSSQKPTSVKPQYSAESQPVTTSPSVYVLGPSTHHCQHSQPSILYLLSPQLLHLSRATGSPTGQTITHPGIQRRGVPIGLLFEKIGSNQNHWRWNS